MQNMCMRRGWRNSSWGAHQSLRELGHLQCLVYRFLLNVAPSCSRGGVKQHVNNMSAHPLGYTMGNLLVTHDLKN